MTEIRYYKGKYCVEILKKSKGNYLVQALEDIELRDGWSKMLGNFINFFGRIPKGSNFTTVPRLLWRHPRK